MLTINQSNTQNVNNDPKYSPNNQTDINEVLKVIEEINQAISQTQIQVIQTSQSISPQIINPYDEKYGGTYEDMQYQDMKDKYKTLKTITDPGMLISKINPALALPVSALYSTLFLMPAKYGKNTQFLEKLSNMASQKLDSYTSSQIYSDITSSILSLYALNKAGEVFNTLYNLRRAKKEFGPYRPFQEDIYQTFKILYSTVNLPLKIPFSLMGMGLTLKVFPYVSSYLGKIASYPFSLVPFIGDTLQSALLSPLTLANFAISNLGSLLLSSGAYLTRAFSPINILSPLSFLPPFTTLSSFASQLPIVGQALSSPGVLPFGSLVLGNLALSFIRQLAFRKYKPQNVDAYEIEQQTSASQAIQPFLIRAVTLDKSIKTIDVLMLQTLMLIEAHTSIIPLIYNLLHSEKETKRVNVDFTSEREYWDLTLVGRENIAWYEPIRKKISELEFKLNPLSQLFTFITTGMTPKQFIERVIYGEERYIKEVESFSSILGTNQSVTVLLGKSAGILISNARTYEAKMLMLVSGIYDLLRQAVLELITIRKLGFSIESSFNISYTKDEIQRDLFENIVTFGKGFLDVTTSAYKALFNLALGKKEEAKSEILKQKDLLKDVVYIPGINAIAFNIKFYKELIKGIKDKTILSKAKSLFKDVYLTGVDESIEKIDIKEKVQTLEKYFDKSYNFSLNINESLKKIISFFKLHLKAFRELLKIKIKEITLLENILRCICFSNNICQKEQEKNITQKEKYKDIKLVVVDTSIKRALEKLPKFKEGGKVPGKDKGKDEILAWLRPGEYVVKKESVEKVGKETLETINEKPNLLSKLLSAFTSTLNFVNSASLKSSLVTEKLKEFEIRKKEKEERKFKVSLLEKLDFLVRFFKKQDKSFSKVKSKKDEFSFLDLFTFPLAFALKSVYLPLKFIYQKVGKKIFEKAALAFTALQSKIMFDSLSKFLLKWVTGYYGYKLYLKPLSKLVFKTSKLFVTFLSKFLFSAIPSLVKFTPKLFIGPLTKPLLSLSKKLSMFFMKAIYSSFSFVLKHTFKFIYENIVKNAFKFVSKIASKAFSFLSKLLVPRLGFGVGAVLSEIIFGKDGEGKTERVIGAGIGAVAGSLIGNAIFPFAGGLIGSIIGAEIGKATVPKIIDALKSISIGDIFKFAFKAISLIPKLIYKFFKFTVYSISKIKSFIFGENPSLANYIGGSIGIILGAPLGPIGMIFAGKLGAYVGEKLTSTFNSIYEKLKLYTLDISNKIYEFVFAGEDNKNLFDNLLSLFLGTETPTNLHYAGAGIGGLIGFLVLGPVGVIFGSLLGARYFPVLFEKFINFGKNLKESLSEKISLLKEGIKAEIEEKGIVGFLIDTIIYPIKVIFKALISKIKNGVKSIVHSVGKFFKNIPFVGGVAYNIYKSIFGIKEEENKQESKIDIKKHNLSYQYENQTYIVNQEAQKQNIFKSIKQTFKTLPPYVDEKLYLKYKDLSPEKLYKLKLEAEKIGDKKLISTIKFILKEKAQSILGKEYKDKFIWSKFDIQNLPKDLQEDFIKITGNKPFIVVPDKYKEYVRKLKISKDLEYNILTRTKYESLLSITESLGKKDVQTQSIIPEFAKNTIEIVKSFVTGAVTEIKEKAKDLKKDEKTVESQGAINFNLINIFDEKTRKFIYSLFDNSLVKLEEYASGEVVFENKLI